MLSVCDENTRAPSTRIEKQRQSQHVLGSPMMEYMPLAGAPSMINPTRRLGGPSFKCLNTFSAPMKSALSLRSFPTKGKKKDVGKMQYEGELA